MTDLTIGRAAWYYADHGNQTGMQTNDPSKPFAAIVVDVLDERVVNLVAFDHNGVAHPCQSVAVFLGDDDDNKSAVAHCELEAPAEPERQSVEVGTDLNDADHGSERELEPA